jgi:two-component system, cell cycle response regulator
VKVLIAEDDPTTRMMYERLVGKWGYDVVAVEDGSLAWDVLQGDDPPPLALLDWMMPGIDGVSLCKRLRAGEEGKRTYVVLVTARGRKDDLVEAMDAGADDYLVKPVAPEELRVRLRAGQRILDLQSELYASREAFRERSRRDSLTGLLNSRAIFDVLARHLEIGLVMETPVSVILADLDEFKKLNDSFGHRAGDAILVEFARHLGGAVRSSDAVGRWGGEEFLVVLPGARLDAATALAERIRAAFDGSPVRADEQEIHATASLGVACSAAFPSAGVDALVEAADRALYRAKGAGRNRVVTGPNGSGPLDRPGAPPDPPARRSPP